MDKLNYDTLQSFKPNTHLEIVDVDVKRLRDDRSELQLGQEVAFVATFALRVTQQGIALLLSKQGADCRKKNGRTSPGNATDCWHNLAAEDKLLIVGADAELRSDKVPIDEDSVTWWIGQNYTFTFLLNGQKDAEKHRVFRDVGQVRVSTGDPLKPQAECPLPWLKKLSIGDVKEDYIDVDVRIEEKARVVDASGPPVVFSPDGPKRSGQMLGLTLEARIEDAAVSLRDLVDRPFRLVSENNEAQISFVLRITSSGDGKPALGAAGASSAKTSS